MGVGKGLIVYSGRKHRQIVHVKLLCSWKEPAGDRKACCHFRKVTRSESGPGPSTTRGTLRSYIEEMPGPPKLLRARVNHHPARCTAFCWLRQPERPTTDKPVLNGCTVIQTHVSQSTKDCLKQPDWAVSLRHNRCLAAA